MRISTVNIYYSFEVNQYFVLKIISPDDDLLDKSPMLACRFDIYFMENVCSENLMQKSDDKNKKYTMIEIEK